MEYNDSQNLPTLNVMHLSTVLIAVSDVSPHDEQVAENNIWDRNVN